MNDTFVKETLNRKTAPVFRKVEHIELLQPQQTKLSNGIPVFIIGSGQEALVKVDIVFDAGIKFEEKSSLAHACNTLLNGGTQQYNSADLAEAIDYYGSFFETDIQYDQATVTLYSLNKYLSETLPLINNILTDSIFPATELETYIANSREKLKVKLEKNDFVAREKFRSLIFGSQHPYGKSPAIEDFEKLSREDLVSFFKRHYQNWNCSIVISGKVEDKEINLLEKYFGDMHTQSNNSFSSSSTINTKPELFYQEKKDALQSAIRMGRILFNKKHPDYFGMKVLNEILGGYFGSRLMANIREDKGYTYGIHSGIMSYLDAGYFFISTEVGAEVTQATLNEIHSEIKKLQQEPVSADELDLVRNYMLGSFMSSLENVFSHAEKFRSIYPYGLQYDYYSKYFDTIRTINSVKLMELANQYLNIEDMTQVVVGKM